MSDPKILVPEEDEPQPCWCGEPDPYCDDAVFERDCGGSGTLQCYCGGDLCVCHNHGEVDCPGCDDCENDFDCDDRDDDDCDDNSDDCDEETSS